MKTIGIVGTRSRDSDEDFKIVKAKFLELYYIGDVICSGKCYKGADRFAELLQKEYNTAKLWFPANWKKYGRKAGFIRNTDIARESDVLIACVSKNRAGGTEDTIDKFIKFHGKNQLHIIH